MEPSIDIPRLPVAIPGIVVLFIATSAFGVGWLPQPWLIPTEIYPSTARAQGAAISVVTWGFANFAVTFLSPILFNNLYYWIFLVFAITNAFAGVWTWVRQGISNFLQLTDPFPSYTRPRLVTVLSRRMPNSSLMQRSTTPGACTRSITANFLTCRSKRKIQSVCPSSVANNARISRSLLALGYP